MKILYEDSSFTIKFDEQIKLIHTSWTENTTNLEEEKIKTFVNLFVNSLDEYTPDFIFSDDSKRMSVYPVSIQEWVANTIAIAAIRANVLKYGIILPHDFISSMSTEQTVDEVTDLPFKLSYFEDEESARNWFSV